MPKTSINKKIILFDGVCNLCNTSVNRIIKYDKKNIFIFCALQSEKGKEIIKSLKINTTTTDSIILYESRSNYYIKSTAILKITSEFGGLWTLSILGFIVPKTIRDVVYDFIAKNRYNWFGRKQSCMLPSKEVEKKFIA